MSRVLVVGSVNTDFTVYTPRLPRPNETVLGENYSRSFGGKGANQAMASLRAGAEVTLVAKIGTDADGAGLRSHLIQSGLPAEGLKQELESAAGVALIVVDATGNNQIVVAPGSNARLTEADVEPWVVAMQPGDVLLAQLETPWPAVERALVLAKERGMCTILNPAPYMELPAHIYPYLDFITPNEHELAGLAELDGIRTLDQARQAAQSLQLKGVGTVIVTMGGQGSLRVDARGSQHYPPFVVESVDAVGAGDAFNGVLAAALAAGQDLDRALQWANAAGALCTTGRGAQQSLPWRSEIEALCL